MGGGGAVLAQPLEESLAIPTDEFQRALAAAESLATEAGITGPKVTPFLLGKLAELTNGKTLAANRKLIVANARLAAQVAKCFHA